MVHSVACGSATSDDDVRGDEDDAGTPDDDVDVSEPTPAAEPAPSSTPGSPTSGLDTGPFDIPVDLDEAPIGWASAEGLERSETTGGAPFEPVRVTTMEALQMQAGAPLPRVVLLDGEFTGRLDITSHKTLIGAPGASFHGTINIAGVQNVIVRNLTVVGNNCTDSPSDCSDGSDAISVRNSHHIWFDHLDVSDGSDGNLDITEGSDYVTVSWSKFWYSNDTRDHRFSNLVGAADNNPVDEGRLKVTFHHNWWADNAQQRMPRTRYGDIHIFNNLYTSVGNDYCIASGQNARLLVESNVFQGVDDPLTQMGSNGSILSIGNVFAATSGDQVDTGSAFTPPYEYTLDATDSLEETIMNEVGPLK